MDNECTLSTSTKKLKKIGSGTPKTNNRQKKTYNAFIGESLCNPYQSELVKDVICIPISDENECHWWTKTQIHPNLTANKSNIYCDVT